MYSCEIQKELERYNYRLSPTAYCELFSLKESPQITQIKYDAFSDNFHVETNDNYSWTFIVEHFY